MPAYYNEIDPFCVNWLRMLIEKGEIADGIVDSRPIQEITPNELREYTQCHFFAGTGAWSYALRQAGWPDNRPVWTGSCPCQPFSIAGRKNGFTDERHLFPFWFHHIAVLAPVTVFGEQIVSEGSMEWFDLVRSDFENQNYEVGAAITVSCAFDTTQVRKRLYFVANATGQRWTRFHDGENESNPAKTGLHNRCHATANERRQLEANTESIPYLDGTPLWMARRIVKGYGNAIVIPQAKAFIESYMEHYDLPSR